jgi:Ca2+-binding EF-hand superfamily protein
MGSVSREEFRKALSTLRRKGLSDVDLNNLRNAASGHFDREPGLFGGRSMSKQEVDTMIQYLKENPSRHHLSKTQIKKAEEELREDLND